MLTGQQEYAALVRLLLLHSGWSVPRMLIFVTQFLTIPELLHRVRMQEWIKRNSLHQEKDPCN
jgi:hypothetical protein